MSISLDAKSLRRFFQDNHVCESLTLDEVEILSGYMNEVTLMKDDIIADINTVSDEMYVILSGALEIIHQDQSGSMVEVGRMGEGTLAGEISFFNRQPRNVGMRAERDHTRLLSINYRMYQRLKFEHPVIAVNLLENAIMSLETLIRTMGDDMTILSSYFYSVGKQ